MKKQTLFGIFFTASLTVFSMAFVLPVFAGNSTHTITVINNSNTTLKPDSARHEVTYNSTTDCAALAPTSSSPCDQVSLDPPSSIGPGQSAVLHMTGPAGCNVSQWQTYWDPVVKGKKGTIHCTISPINVCNSVNKNYTCTISQANVDTASAGNGALATAQ